jgi:hypothetical protein
MVNNSENIKLFKFIENETGIILDESCLNFSVQKDLGIYGDEAYDFILNFSNIFQVDITEFKFNEYFNNEIDGISLLLISFFKKSKKSQLTVEKLRQAIISKKLI